MGRKPKPRPPIPPPKGRKNFAWSPIRELMKANGAEMVARDAVDELISVLERQAKDLTNRALEFSRHAGRKKVTAEDMNIALKLKK